MKSILLLAATSLLFLIPQSVQACSCAFTTPATAYNDVTAVFVGKMIGGTETNVINTGDGREISLESGDVTFEVGKVYKGSIAKSVTISVTSNKGTSCGTYGLVRNVEYIVWAYSWDKSSGKLSTGVCTRTRPLESSSSKEDLDFLNSLPPKGSGGSIKGSVSLDTKEAEGGGSKNLANITVSIESVQTGKVVVVKTNKDGKFELLGVPAGRYKVMPKVPKGYFIEEPSDEVDVDDLGTAVAGFEFQYNGHIAGSIKDRNGHPFDFGSVGIDDERLWLYGHSFGKDGKYKIEGIPPGRYRLFIEVKDAVNGKEKKYYYPGTYDVKMAKWITVGLGETVQAADFVLPPEFRVRKLIGRVFDKDGNPVANASVSLNCSKAISNLIGTLDGLQLSITTDEDGKYSLQGFEGFSYWLSSLFRIPGPNNEGTIFSPPHFVEANDGRGGFDLFLTDSTPAEVNCP